LAKLTIAEEFEVAIRSTAATADQTISSRQIAETFYQDEPDFIHTFQREWVIEKLASLIAARRAKIRRERDPQVRLGFKHLRQRVELPSGKIFRPDGASLWLYQLWRKQLTNTAHPLCAEIDRRIAFHEAMGKKEARYYVSAGLCFAGGTATARALR
jgi:hypothetical protein